MLAAALQLQHQRGDVVARLDLAGNAPDLLWCLRLEVLQERAQIHSSGPSHSVSMVPTPLASACAWIHAPRTISLMAKPRCQKMMRSSTFSRPGRAPCTISPISACTCSRRSVPLAMRGWSWPRSEEHTSELQSRGHLVCRLLLEKKKKTHFLLILLKNKKKIKDT